VCERLKKLTGERLKKIKLLARFLFSSFTEKAIFTAKIFNNQPLKLKVI